MADLIGHDRAKLMKKRQLRDGITARNSFLSVNYKENYPMSLGRITFLMASVWMW